MHRNLHCPNDLKKQYPAEFRSWSLMWNRCQNENNPDYPFYGGSGISVEDESWSDFAVWLQAVGERPEPKSAFCLARIDKTKGYCLSNVRWSDRKQTCENYRHWNRARTHCRRNHLLGPGNLVREGSRACLKCAKLTRRRYIEAKKKARKEI
jgi:hypothetical protein